MIKKEGFEKYYLSLKEIEKINKDKNINILSVGNFMIKKSKQNKKQLMQEIERLNDYYFSCCSERKELKMKKEELEFFLKISIIFNIFLVAWLLIK